MSEQQIQKILERLDEQDKTLANLTEQIKPMVKLINDAVGFRDIMIVLLKGIMLFGGAAGVIAGFIIWLKEK